MSPGKRASPPPDPERRAIEAIRALADQWEESARRDACLYGPGNPAPAARLADAVDLRNLSNLLISRAKGRRHRESLKVRRLEAVS